MYHVPVLSIVFYFLLLNFSVHSLFFSRKMEYGFVFSCFQLDMPWICTFQKTFSTTLR